MSRAQSQILLGQRWNWLRFLFGAPTAGASEPAYSAEAAVGADLAKGAIAALRFGAERRDPAGAGAVAQLSAWPESGRALRQLSERAPEWRWAPHRVTHPTSFHLHAPGGEGTRVRAPPPGGSAAREHADCACAARLPLRLLPLRPAPFPRVLPLGVAAAAAVRERGCFEGSGTLQSGDAGRLQACRYPKPEIAIVKRAKEVSSAEIPDSFEKLEAPPPTPGQLRYVFIHNAIPFIGFGFLDNAIMIVAGTHIEMSIGIILGISTMAAAALGNLVSDLAGLGLAGYVEALASRLGLSIPDLTPKQVDMWQTRLSTHLGKAVGVTIGCILGMFPLIFFGGGEEDEKLETKS
uniref:Transmembrane protein 65 n=2 Tax=Simiiformes TaxID=314293 RepID=A0A2K6TZR2_SAIBB